MNRLLLLSIAACTLATSAQAKDPTMDCLRTKIWDTYNEGWSVRSSSDAEVGFGQTSFFKVTLLKGRAYRVLSCAEDGVIDLDLLLYDKQGAVIARDDTQDREPTLAYTPEKTGTYYVVLYLRDLEDRAAEPSVAWGLLHADG